MDFGKYSRSRKIQSSDRKNLDALREKFQKYLDEGMPGNVVALVDRKHNVMFDPDVHTTKDVLDWLWWCKKKDNDAAVTQKVYNSWPNAKYNLPSTVFNDFVSYYDHMNQQKTYGMEIRVRKNTSFEEFEKSLNMLLDNYELTHKVGCKNRKGVGITLYTNDGFASGVNYLIMLDRDKDEWMLGKLSYSSMSQDCPPTSLKDCFEKIINRGYTYDPEW